jgi:type IV secretion system protein VirB5
MFKKSIALILLTAAATGAYAQIPVTDVAMNGQTLTNQAANMAKYIEQITQLKRQYDQAKQTYENISGIRNIGGLMNSQLMRQYLPPDYQQAYNQLRNGQGGSLSGISGQLNTIVRTYQNKACNQVAGASPAVVKACTKTWQTHAMNQYVAEQGYKESARNISELNNFVTAIKSSPDAKSLQDLQARIAVEQIKLQNENLKLQQVAQMQKAQEDMDRQNQYDSTQQMLKPTGSLRF